MSKVEKGILLGYASQYRLLKGPHQRPSPSPSPPPQRFQGMTYESLKINTLTLDTLRLV